MKWKKLVPVGLGVYVGTSALAMAITCCFECSTTCCSIFLKKNRNINQVPLFYVRCYQRPSHLFLLYVFNSYTIRETYIEPQFQHFSKVGFWAYNFQSTSILFYIIRRPLERRNFFYLLHFSYENKLIYVELIYNLCEISVLQIRCPETHFKHTR
jgi:hypothetical protein